MKHSSMTAWLMTAAMVGLTAHVAIAAESEPGVELKWALATSDAKSPSPSAVTKDTQLQSGAKLKFFLEPMSPCSVYLLLLDSSDEMHVLYNEKAKVKTPAADGKAATFVPAGSQWFELDDNPGQETFFLLASAEPLTDLDKLIVELGAADATAKKGVVKRIVDEVRKQQKAHRNFSRPVEKPVVIGGQTRGNSSASSIERLAVEISAEKFYDKTITIEH